jgi:hypothetical protein
MYFKIRIIDDCTARTRRRGCPEVNIFAINLGFPYCERLFWLEDILFLSVG